MNPINSQEQINDLQRRVGEIEKRTKNFQSNATLNQYSFDPQSSSLLSDFMATTMPTGRTHKVADQVIANTTTTKVLYDTNNFANGIKWDSVNNRFIVPFQGRYLVNGSIYYSNPAAGQNCQMMIYKNGVEFVRTISCVGSVSVAFTPTITDIVNCSAGDYIEIYTRQDSGVSKNTVDISPSASRFSICLV